MISGKSQELEPEAYAGDGQATTEPKQPACVALNCDSNEEAEVALQVCFFRSVCAGY